MRIDEFSRLSDLLKQMKAQEFCTCESPPDCRSRLKPFFDWVMEKTEEYKDLLQRYMPTMPVVDKANAAACESFSAGNASETTSQQERTACDGAVEYTKSAWCLMA